MYFQRLRDLREDKDLNQREVAKILETTQQHYSRYEKGEIEIPLHHFIKLANFYGVSLDYLANRKN